MANDYSKNPIVLDTFSASVDIANLAFGLPHAPVFIKHITFHDPTANDIVVLKDKQGNVVAALEAYATNQNLDVDFGQGYCSDGLTLVSTDCTVTTGKVLIYI